MKQMIADEVLGFKKETSQGIADTLPRPKDVLHASRPQQHVEKDADYDSQFAAMDIDEELRMKEAAK